MGNRDGCEAKLVKNTLLFFGDYWDSMWRCRQQLASHLTQTGIIDSVVNRER
jgi:hypothetical protein